VITYHCDLHMPPGITAWAANQAVLLMNNLAARFTHRIVTYTRDYAENSPYLTHFMSKLHVIPPPVVLPEVRPDQVAEFAQRTNPANHRPVIGMAARFATEKGVEILLDALPEVLKAFPDAQVQFAGPYKNIIGEEDYFYRLEPVIRKYEAEGHWQFLGSLDPTEMAMFYPNLDALVLPSLNSTEAFGLVQIEAMINGTPSIASNLPGVRQPVRWHEMGKVVPIGDSGALADALIEVLSDPEQYQRDPQAIAERYNPDSIAAEYEQLFDEMQREIRK
jgi:glycosyltransferase involved in cell wall biosynthesis